MRVTLECGCTIDDAQKNTVHVQGNTRSKGDQARSKHHYPLHTTPETYCISCDRYRPCSCDITAHA